MYYYNPNDRSPRRWAAAAAALYALLLAGGFAFATFELRPVERMQGDTILIDLTEPPVSEPPQPPRRPP